MTERSKKRPSKHVQTTSLQCPKYNNLCPSTTIYAGKTTPIWNSSLTTSSNASSDLATSYAHEIEETELNDDDDVTSQYYIPNSSTVDDQMLISKKTDSINEDTGNEMHEISPSLEFDDFKYGSENLADFETETCVVLDDLKETEVDTFVCSRCGCRYSDINTTKEEFKLCENCQNSQSALVSDEDRMNPVEVESPKVTRFEQNQDLVKDGESGFVETHLEEKEPTKVNHQVIHFKSQPSCSEVGIDQIQHGVDLSDSNVDSLFSVGNDQIQHTVDFSDSNVDSLVLGYAQYKSTQAPLTPDLGIMDLSWEDNLTEVWTNTCMLFLPPSGYDAVAENACEEDEGETNTYCFQTEDYKSIPCWNFWMCTEFWGKLEE
ncbi:hypothetical protein L1887_35949 [Cichorium endivia]|nr:hypothetical protein L1887_35949 [Cichorium endivia]